VDSTVVRTTGDQSISGNISFVGELIMPQNGGVPTNNGSIYHNNIDVFAIVNGESVKLTPQSDVGEIEDVGDTGVDVYAGFRTVSIGNANVKYHGIRSISSGIYTNVTVSSNVITVDGNISGIRTGFSTSNVSGFGGLTYNSTTGVISHVGVSTAEIRNQISGTGLIAYSNSTGVISTTADNYNSWKFTTSSAGNTDVASGNLITFAAGSGITVSHTGSTITITNNSTADITGVSAGNGLVGGGESGNVTLNVVGGYGITVNPDNVTVNNSEIQAQANAAFSNNTTTNLTEGTNLYFTATRVRGNIGVSGSTGIDYNSTAGLFSLSSIPNSSLTNSSITINGTPVALGGTRTLSTTDVAEGANLYFTTARSNSAMDAYLVGGNGLTYTAGNLNVGAGSGITVNADNVALTSGIISTGAKTYGTAAAVPVITVDTFGRTTSISNTTISITASQVSDFNTAIDTRVVGGNGLTYTSGNLNVVAGPGITVNADNVALTSGIVTAAAQSGGISAITVDTFGRVTSVTANAGFTTNTGTVTSVGGTGTVSGLTLTGTVTTSGSLTLGGTLAVAASNFASQTTKTFLAAPNASNGVPTFRTIVASDVPTLNQNTTGSAATLTTPRAINGVNFNGSAAITVPGNFANRTTDESGHAVFIGTTATGNQSMFTNTNYRFNPSTAELSATNFNSTSDINKKHNIETIEGALDIVNKLRGVRFNWNHNNQAGIGVVAQEIEQYVPEVVVSLENSKTVQYGNLVGLLIEAIKELQQQIEELKNR
jgi:hypothetical protein